MVTEKESYRGYLCGGCDQPVAKKDRVCPHCGIRFNPLMGFKVYHNPDFILYSTRVYKVGCVFLMILVLVIIAVIDGME